MEKIFRKRLGRYAENIAARFLKRKGFRIIDRNFFCRLGEIDIVAEDGDEFVFVEVRSGSDYCFADPLESIQGLKIKRLKNLALTWLNQHHIQESKMRFDAVIIVFKKKSREKILERLLRRSRHIEIRHIKNII